MTRALLALLLLGGVAHASVWDDAIAHGKPDPAQDKYDSEMRDGDQRAMLANTRSGSKKEVANQVQLAAASYRAAAAAKPEEGEPYFRLGRLIYSFYLECNDELVPPQLTSPLCDLAFDRRHAEEVIAAWDEFEKRAPMDPRFGVTVQGISEILFRRAILHTKLATKPHLAEAAKDYEKILARQDNVDGPAENVVGNLAETYMMLGRLEESIETYKQALRGAGEPSTWYGFAVALDRDERTDQAFDVIRSLGAQSRDAFHRAVMRRDTFYVPEGEKFYYFALVDEAFGADDAATESWQRFIKSGAHPEFQGRARAHLDALAKKKRKGALPFEPPWRGILR